MTDNPGRIDLKAIRNLIVRKALMKRCSDFMFSIFGYSDEHSDSKEGGVKHRDHSWYGDYSERAGHSDCTAGSKAGRCHTDHTERYSDHGDYQCYKDAYHNEYYDQNR